MSCRLRGKGGIGVQLRALHQRQENSGLYQPGAMGPPACPWPARWFAARPRPGKSPCAFPARGGPADPPPGAQPAARHTPATRQDGGRPAHRGRHQRRGQRENQVIGLEYHGQRHQQERRHNPPFASRRKPAQQAVQRPQRKAQPRQIAVQEGRIAHWLHAQHQHQRGSYLHPSVMQAAPGQVHQRTVGGREIRRVDQALRHIAVPAKDALGEVPSIADIRPERDWCAGRPRAATIPTGRPA